jgi:Rrf2 family protein
MLSKKTKYAINALLYLAKAGGKDPIPAKQIAAGQNIPYKFLEGILLDMKHAGLVMSQQGKFGGYLLNRPTEEINMADVMRLFDGAVALLPCVTHKYYKRCEECTDEVTCGIRQVFLEIRNETVNRLKSATLADILKRESSLEKGK